MITISCLLAYLTQLDITQLPLIPIEFARLIDEKKIQKPRTRLFSVSSYNATSFAYVTKYVAPLAALLLDEQFFFQRTFIPPCTIGLVDQFFTLSKVTNLPGFPGRLHLVGHRHVVGPDVVLPFPQTQNTAEDSARVDADSHVQLHVRGFHNGTEEQTHLSLIVTKWFDVVEKLKTLPESFAGQVDIEIENKEH